MKPRRKAAKGRKADESRPAPPVAGTPVGMMFVLARTVTGIDGATEPELPGDSRYLADGGIAQPDPRTHVTWTSEVSKEIGHSIEARHPTASGAYWRFQVLLNGASSVLEAANELESMRDTTVYPGSTLAMLGAQVSKRLRRKILLRELKLAGWNLSFCSDRLRMGGSGNVIRAIKELDLAKEYEAAKAAGLVKTGGRHPRVAKPVNPSKPIDP